MTQIHCVGSLRPTVTSRAQDHHDREAEISQRSGRVSVVTEPVLVLLPGFDGTGELFRPLLASMDGHHRAHCIAYDNFASLSDYIDSAEAQIPDDHPVCLVAESFSGPIALELLRRGNRDYRCAVLSTTFAKPPLGLVLSLAQKLRLASFVPPPVSEQILRVFCLNGVHKIDRILEIVDVVRAVPARSAQSRMQALSQMDATSFLHTIDIPVTVINATSDRVLRPRYSQSLLDNLPDVRHVKIDGPHLLLQANPDACAEEIARSLALIG